MESLERRVAKAQGYDVRSIGFTDGRATRPALFNAKNEPVWMNDSARQNTSEQDEITWLWSLAETYIDAEACIVLAREMYQGGYLNKCTSNMIAVWDALMTDKYEAIAEMYIQWKQQASGEAE